MRHRSLVAAALVFSALAVPVRAGTGDAVARLTVYDAGVAEFLEERTVELQTGLNTVEWRSLMPKAFLRTVRVVVADAEVVRQDVTYDGAEVRSEKSPVLHLVIRNTGAAGPRKVQVDYLAPGLDWENDYTLVLDPTADGAPATGGVLDSWVSVNNNTGADLAAGAVDLVAGEISLVAGAGGSPVPRSYQVQAQSNVAYGGEAGEAGESFAEVSSISAFSRFTLGRSVSMTANAPVSRFPLFQRARLAIEQRNVFENEYNAQTLGRGGFTLLPRGLEVRLVSKNTTGAPMPAGVVTVYARSGDLAQIVGQDRITLTPQNLELTVSQGRSSTLLGSRKIVERREDSYDAPGGRRDKLTTTVEVTLTNRGPRPADAWIRDGVEPFADNRWTVLTSSSPAERLGANTVQFKVAVPANGKTVVTYTVETK